jgi:beta-phosphoglucomutase-like phosphatase (HAD superfamily)
MTSAGRTGRLRGAIFDVDGVLVDSPHERAWRESLRELMEDDWRDLRHRSSWSPEAFTPLVYQQEVSGRPRESGARAALGRFGLPTDGAHVEEYARRKQTVLVRLIDAGEFTAYPDALRFLIAVKDAGLRIAAASSSKNAGHLMSMIRLDTFAERERLASPVIRPGLTLLSLLDVDVSGRDFARGKPDPEMFLSAAHELGIEPAEAVVLEDATAGIQAAKAGGMAAIGITRADDADLLAGAGADLVVTSLDEIAVDLLREGGLAIRRSPPSGA